jgi:protein SCO1/2
MTLLAIVALVAGVFIAQRMSREKSIDLADFHGTWLEVPRAVPPFELTGIDHKPFNNASLKGRWTLVFFGFTHCGSICPITLGELGQMHQLLEKEGVQPLPTVVMVSVDPDRDDLERLSQYVKAFDPHFYGARGSETVVQAMAQAWGIVYAKITSSNPKDYTIEHTGTLMLFDPQGQLRAFFTSPHQAEWLAEDYKKIKVFS